MIDIAHALTNNLESTGRVEYSIKDYTVSGPQKAMQAFVAELLSSSGPVSRTNEPFMSFIKKGYLRDKTALYSAFTIYIKEALASIDDTTRPLNERIWKAEITDFVISGADSIILNIRAESLAKETFLYEVPVPL